MRQRLERATRQHEQAVADLQAQLDAGRSRESKLQQDLDAARAELRSTATRSAPKPRGP